MAVYPLGERTFLIEQHLAAPGAVTPLNAFVVRSASPLVVDTAGPAVRPGFLDDLARVVPLVQIRYIAITHADPDHTGALVSLLEAAPTAQILTDAMGQVKLAGDFGLDAARFHVVDVGDTIELGNERLSVHRVPLYDQPETRGFFLERDRVFCAADCWGAILPQVAAFADTVATARYRAGFVFWNVANHPWVRLVDPVKFRREVDAIRGLHPRVIASAHGPAIRRAVDRACDWLEALANA